MPLPDELGRYFAATDDFPGVVRLTRGADVVFEGAFGLARRTGSLRNTLATRFDATSITELFTVAAMLRLVDAGALALDTPVVAFLQLDDTTISRQVTVHQLLTHTSGIGDGADEEAWFEGFRHAPAWFAPGEGCRYSRAGYVLLDLCVERATGVSYREHVTHDVFGPAGMTRSGFVPMDGVVGGAHVTAADLERFLTAAHGGRLFSPEMTAAFVVPHVFHSQTADRISRYGLGLEFVFDLDGHLRYVQKDGHNVGASGIVRHYPAADLTVVLLSSTSEGVGQPVRDIDEMLAVASCL